MEPRAMQSHHARRRALEDSIEPRFGAEGASRRIEQDGARQRRSGGGHTVVEPEARQHGHRIRLQRQAGARRMNGRRALEHAHPDARADQGDRRGEAADARARDDGVANRAQCVPSLSTNAVSRRLNSCGFSIITKWPVPATSWCS